MKTASPTLTGTSSRRAARTAHKPLRPFTVEHFRSYAGRLILDSGAYWEPEAFQLEVAEDLFSGVAELWLVVPEGNGKTTLLSGLGLYHGDYQQDAEVLLAASSRDQCGLLERQAGGFIKRTPGLDKRFRWFEGYRRIQCFRTGGRIQVYAADERTGDGVIPTLALLDELHRHKTLSLYRTWQGKLDKRGGQLVTISTAGVPGSEFEATRSQMRSEFPDVTRDGLHVRASNGETVLHDFGLRPGDDPEDMEVVKRANPFGGVTVESLTRKRASPAMTKGHWLRMVCNVATRTDESAVGESEWADAATDSDIATGEPCDLGIDLGWKWDTTAIVPLFQRDYGHLLGPAVILVPPRDGNSLDPQHVYDALTEQHEQHPVRRVVLDPAAGGDQLAAWIESELGVEVVAYSQKASPMSLAAERFMEGLRGGTLRHVRDPGLTRHVLNATARALPDGTFRFERPSSNRTAVTEQSRREIDALIAAAIVHAVAQKPAPYSGPIFELIR